MQTKIELHHILKDGRWLLVDRLFRLFMGLLVGAWVARYLGPNQFGELAYALAYVAIFQSIASLGLDGIVVREIALRKMSAGKILGTAFILRLGVGLFVWVASILGAIFAYGLESSNIVLIAIIGGSLIFQASDVLDLWFQSQSKNQLTVISKSISFLVSSGIKVVLISCHASLIYFALVILLEAILSASGLIIVYLRSPSLEIWRYSQIMARNLLKESWPYVMSALSITFYMRIDQIMIKNMLGLQDLGIYAAVQPFATTWQFIPTTLITILAPLFAKKKMEGEVQYWNVLKFLFEYFALIGWVICLTIWFLSDSIVRLLFGPSYQGGGPILQVYIFTFIFLSMGVAQSLWSINERRSSFWLYKTFFGMSISVFGNMYFLPRYGLIGAAWVAVLAQCCAAVISNIWTAPRVLRLQINALLFGWFYALKSIIKLGIK